MARFNHIQTSFNSGEFSPRLYTRTAFERYKSAVKFLENYWITPHGSVYKRPGTKFIAATKTESVQARLIPFVFNTDQAYVIEAGNLYFRFYTESGRLESPPGTPVEIVTPYTTAQLAQLQWAQVADVMYFVHPDVQPQVLARTSATTFTMTPFVFYDGPYLSPNTDEANILRVTDRVGTINVLAEAPYAPFTPDHVGSVLRINLGGKWGYVRIASFINAGNVTATVEESLADHLNLATTSANTRALRLATSTATDALSQGITNELQIEYRDVELFLRVQGTGLINNDNVWVEIRDDASGEPAAAHIARSRKVIVGSFNPAGEWVRFRFDELVTLSAGTQHHIVLRGDYDRSDTDNVLWEGNIAVAYEDGIAQEYDGSTWSAASSIGTFMVRRNSTDLFRFAAFSDQTGWPRAVCLFDQRLFYGGADGAPQSYFGSTIGDFTTFTPGVLDSDAVYYTLGESELNKIEWLAGLEDLFIGTAGGEFKIESGTTATLTPTNPGIVKNVSSYGTAPLVPIRAAKHLVFVQRGGTVLREIAYTDSENSYDGVDISILAEHMFKPGISYVAYQTDPDPLILCVRTDGVLLTGAYHRQQDVIGWSRTVTDGQFESVAVIPHPTEAGGQIWCVVNRTIDGATHRYVEFFGRVEGSTYESMYVDSGLTRTGAATSTLTGLDHLEGEVVSLQGDGAVYPPFTVSGGAITGISPTVSVAEVGLPYTASLTTLRPFAGDSNVLNFKMSDVWCAINVIDSLGMTVNGDPVPFGVGYPVMGMPPDFVEEGTIEVPTLQWSVDVPLVIAQPDPLPLHIIGITRVIQTQEV